MVVELLSPADATPANPKWHELRRAGISASEIAAVMGISSWESPFSLFWRKVEGWDVEPNAEMSAGTRAEPVIADWFADQHLDHVELRPAGLYAHDDRPWQLATPDRLGYSSHAVAWGPPPPWIGVGVDDGWDRLQSVLECKYVVHGWDGWGEPGTDDIPVHYRAQVLWQLDTLDLDTGYVAAWHGAEFREYLVRRDERDLRLMREHGRRFMDRLEAQDPPPLDEHPATLAAVKALHPSVEDRDVEVPANLVAGYERARQYKVLAETAVLRYETALRAAIGTGRRAVCDGRTVATRTVYERAGYTTGPALIDRLTPARRKK